MMDGDEDLKKRLTPDQFFVTQRCGTELPFSGEYWDCHDAGMYLCVVCGTELFSSETKFESGSGWPSFYKTVKKEAVAEKGDASHGMTRIEINCARCGAHLGHVFPDGPNPTGLRYCVNSAALKLRRK